MGEPTIEAQSEIEVGGEMYSVVKTGRAQARQVIQLTQWASKHGYRAARSVQQGSTSMTGLEFIVRMVEELDEGALVDLFTAIVGCDPAVSEVHFDIATLIETAVAIYNGQPAIQRLIDRFFSTPNSSGSTEEHSTPSDQPTDGQMK